jgi:enamine deaminase RidA (YjgF/YER057c/UK114 family)
MAEFFGADTLPAATLIGVQALAMPEFLVEVQATAVVEK